MKFRSFFFLLFFVSLTAQSPYNAIGHGIILDSPDAASLAFSSTGLIPSFNSRFSSSNPTTWTDLVFTYLTGHYNAEEVNTGSFRSGLGTLSTAAFIVPINGKYAFGMGMTPISRKSFDLMGDTTSVVFSGDTLTLSKTMDGSGGISTMFAGGAWNVSPKHTIGIRFDFLFGVYDEHTVSHIDYRSSEYARRFAYKGTFLSGYYRFVPTPEKRRLSAFAGFQLPFGSQYIARTDFFTYVESDLQPRMDFVLPTTLSGGLIYSISSSIHAGAELVIRSFFGSSEADNLNTLDGEMGRANRISIGLTREKIFGSRDIMNMFHYRVGFFRRSHYIRELGNDLTEMGLSFGIGVPFGLTQNQLDFGFRISRRNGFLSDSPETINQFSVGLTLGDLWLVKGKRR